MNDDPFSFGGPDRSGHDTIFIEAILGHLLSLPESLFEPPRLVYRPLSATPEYWGSSHSKDTFLDKINANASRLQ